MKIQKRKLKSVQFKNECKSFNERSKYKEIKKFFKKRTIMRYGRKK